MDGTWAVTDSFNHCVWIFNCENQLVIGCLAAVEFVMEHSIDH